MVAEKTLHPEDPCLEDVTCVLLAGHRGEHLAHEQRMRRIHARSDGLFSTPGNEAFAAAMASQQIARERERFGNPPPTAEHAARFKRAER